MNIAEMPHPQARMKPSRRSFYLKPDLHERLQRAAAMKSAREGVRVSESEFIRQAVDEKIRHEALLPE